ncbi:MAG: T9SS type A sorting domain-containing protein [Candidatus Kapaibacterium sp.]
MKSIFTSVFLIAIVLMLSPEAKAQTVAEAKIIEQPKDVIECEGSLDQYLFVVAAPSEKQYKIANRWLKDGRPISSWVADFGQLTFDTLRYRMSGLYNAELFAYDPNWTSAFGNPFNFDSARVSPIVSSDKANLYVLQPPSFMRDIESQTLKKGDDCIFTFDANINGEHNMDDPTYWTDIQWFKNSIALTETERISGSKSSILTINNLDVDDFSSKYRVRLSGDCDTIWSNVFTIISAPVPRLVLESVYPRYGGTKCIGESMWYSIRITSTPKLYPLEYQWYMNNKPIKMTNNKFIMESEIDSLPNFTDISIRIYWNKDFESDVQQDFYCEIWPKGFKSYKMRVDVIPLTWEKHIELVKDLEDEYLIEEGQDLAIGIEVKNHTNGYNWYYENVKLSVTDSLYTFNNIQLDQSGIYQVMTSNNCGFLFSNVTKVTVTPKQTITGIENNTANQEISIYPNPLTANSTLTISPTTGKVSVILADLLGNKLANIFEDNIKLGQIESIKLNIDNLGLSSGTYYLIIQMGDKVETRQISVVR